MIQFGALFKGKLLLYVVLGIIIVAAATVAIVFSDTRPNYGPTNASPTESPIRKNELHLYPLNNTFIGYYESEETEVENDITYQTIIVMDRSGSMGSQAQRLVQKIFPLFFSKLSYAPSNIIQLITFDSISEKYAVRVDEFPSLPITSRGNTLMTDAVKLCQDVFETLDNNSPVRVLTISDGEIQDQPTTAAQAVILRNYLRSLDPRFLINSNAVRLFTSSSQPDTTAITSLLQINNGPSNSLLDISANKNDNEIAQEIADFFLTDNFNGLRTISASKPMFKEYPWEDEITSSLKLSPGENVFWLTESPSDGFVDNGEAAEAFSRSSLNADEFEVLIRSKFDAIVEKIKVFKILDTVDSNETIEKIKLYFPSMIQLIPVGQRNVPKMAVFIEIENLANDQTVRGMSQEEKAEYLRTKIILPPLEIVS